MPARHASTRRNPTRVGEKVREYLYNLAMIIEEAREQKAEVESAWEEKDYERLHAAGVIDKRELDALNEGRGR